MPPAKSSARNQDDHKSEATNQRERATGTGSAKMRRGASQPGHNQARDVANAPTSAPVQPPPEPVAPSVRYLCHFGMPRCPRYLAATFQRPYANQKSQLPWSSFDRQVLHAYRREHSIDTPVSFTSTYHKWILSQPAGIGLHSPTMVRKKGHKRQGKDRLALAVRKHFNGVGIQENDVIVDFICKIRNEKSSSTSGPTRQDPLATEQL